METPRRKQLQTLFDEAAFIQEVGYQLADLGPGWVEATLQIENRHLQHHGLVHAGVLGTMADHTAGGAATTVIAEGAVVLTVEYKLNLLRPARGERLRCRADVLKPGRRIIVVESEVFATQGRDEELVAKATVTLAVVQDPTSD